MFAVALKGNARQQKMNAEKASATRLPRARLVRAAAQDRWRALVRPLSVMRSLRPFPVRRSFSLRSIYLCIRMHSGLESRTLKHINSDSVCMHYFFILSFFQ